MFQTSWIETFWGDFLHEVRMSGYTSFSFLALAGSLTEDNPDALSQNQAPPLLSHLAYRFQLSVHRKNIHLRTWVKNVAKTRNVFRSSLRCDAPLSVQMAPTHILLLYHWRCITWDRYTSINATESNSHNWLQLTQQAHKGNKQANKQTNK